MSGRYLLAITALIIALPASGQDIPMIDAVGAYNHSQVMRHRDGTTEKKREPSPDPQKLGDVTPWFPPAGIRAQQLCCA